MEIKNIYVAAKRELSKPRYIFSMIATPLVYGLGTILLFVDLILLLVNKSKFFVPCLVIFGVILVAVIVMESIRPFVLKADAKREAERLRKFFDQNLLADPVTEYELPTNEHGDTTKLTFLQDGIDIGNLHYSYDGFECAIFTSNYRYRVNLVMLFNRTQKGDNEDGEEKGVSRFSLPADINLLSVMNKYNIKIANGDVFAFIKEYPEEAAKQILKYGRVQNNYDKYRVR